MRQRKTQDEAGTVRSAARRLIGAGVCLVLLAGGSLLGGCSNANSTENGAAPDPGAGGDPAVVTFADVTAAAGLGAFRHHTGAFGEKWLPETMGSGVAFIDYDGDGWDDLLLVAGGEWPDRGTAPVPALELYRNNGDGTFARRTAEAGLEGVTAYGYGVTVADYDNDGDEDAFLTTLWENLLLRNDGGVFRDVAGEAGVAGAPVWSSAAVFFDADRDGWLDLFVGNYVRWAPDADVWCTLDGKTKAYCGPLLYEGVPGWYYRNNGDGTFTERTDEAGFAGMAGKTLGAAELDVNGDGWSDLVVANDLQRTLLYINRGDGTFDERGLSSGVAFDENGRARAGMGVDAGMADTTGAASIFIGNFANEMIAVYRYRGTGLFEDRAAVSGIGRPSLASLTFGLFLFDPDLDGDLDLLAVNGDVRDNVEAFIDGVTYRQRPQLFLNDGVGNFTLAAAEGPLDHPIVGRGAAYADYDRDGDLDVAVTENGGPVYLWENRQAGGRYLRVHLEGRASNRDGLGARVVALVEGRRHERRVRTGSSYLSQSERWVTFGLGEATEVDSLLVHWPSGQVDRFGRITADQELHVVEGENTAPLAAR